MAMMSAITLAGILSATPAAAVPATPEGLWQTGRDGGVVEISRCHGGAFCGRIVGLPAGGPGAAMPVDSEGHPQCGLSIITDATKTGTGIWTGEILDPRDGKSYHVQLSVDDKGRLQVRGYVGLPLFGRTVTWTPFAGQIGADCRIVAPETREAGPIGD